MGQRERKHSSGGSGNEDWWSLHGGWLRDGGKGEESTGGIKDHNERNKRAETWTGVIGV